MTFGVTSWSVPGGIGTESEGWDGAAREFASHALQEYAQAFRAGCIDGGPDGLPPLAAMRRYAGQVPQGFAFTVMLSDDALVYRFPYGHPDRGRRGELNPGFLYPGPLRERVCAALDALDGTLDTVVLRLQPVYRTEELRAPEFVDRLDRFLGGFPARTGTRWTSARPHSTCPSTAPACAIRASRTCCITRRVPRRAAFRVRRMSLRIRRH